VPATARGWRLCGHCDHDPGPASQAEHPSQAATECIRGRALYALPGRSSISATCVCPPATASMCEDCPSCKTCKWLKCALPLTPACRQHSQASSQPHPRRRPAEPVRRPPSPWTQRREAASTRRPFRAGGPPRAPEAVAPSSIRITSPTAEGRRVWGLPAAMCRGVSPCCRRVYARKRGDQAVRLRGAARTCPPTSVRVPGAAPASNRKPTVSTW